MWRPGLGAGRGGGRRSCINWLGGTFGDFRSAAARRVTSSKSYSPSQSAGSGAAARRRAARAGAGARFRPPARRRAPAGAPQLFLGARQPAELLVGLPVAAALRVERE